MSKLSPTEIESIYEFMTPFDVINVRFTNRNFYISSVLDKKTNPSQEVVLAIKGLMVNQMSELFNWHPDQETVEKSIPDFDMVTPKSSLIASFPHLYRNWTSEFEPMPIDNLTWLSWVKRCLLKHYQKFAFTLRVTQEKVEVGQARSKMINNVQTTRDLLENVAQDASGDAAELDNLQRDILGGFITQIKEDMKPFRDALRSPLHLLIKMFSKGTWGNLPTVEVGSVILGQQEEFGLFFTSAKCNIDTMLVTVHDFVKESQAQWLAHIIKTNKSLKKIIFFIENRSSSNIAFHPLPILFQGLCAQNLVQEIVCVGYPQNLSYTSTVTMELVLPKSCKRLVFGDSQQMNSHLGTLRTLNSGLGLGFGFNGHREYLFKGLSNLEEIYSESLLITEELLELIASPDCKLTKFTIDVMKSKLQDLTKSKWLSVLSQNTSIRVLNLRIGKDVATFTYSYESIKIPGTSRIGFLKNPEKAQEFFDHLPKGLITLELNMESNFMIYNIISSLANYLKTNKVNLGIHLGASFGEKIADSGTSFNFGTTFGGQEDDVSSISIKAKIISDLLNGLKSCEFKEMSFSSSLTQNSDLVVKALSECCWKDLKCEKISLKMNPSDFETILVIIKQIPAKEVEIIFDSKVALRKSQDGFFEMSCANAIKNKNIKNLIVPKQDESVLHIVTGMCYLLGSDVTLNGKQVTKELILSTFNESKPTSKPTSKPESPEFVPQSQKFTFM